MMKIYGKRPVMERLKAAPQTIKKIYLQEDLKSPELLKLIRRSRLPYIYLTRHQFEKIRRNQNVQGVIADIEDYEYSSLDNLLEIPDTKRPTLLFLDSISDPQNIGSILRTAACLGDFAVVLPQYESCQITETVLRVASGAENYVPVSSVANLSKAIIAAKNSGYYIVATVLEDAENLFQAKLPFPLGLIIGSEAKGIRSGLIKNIDLKLTLPMPGAQISFNVAVAAALFCYEAARQRQNPAPSL